MFKNVILLFSSVVLLTISFSGNKICYAVEMSPAIREEENDIPDLNTVEDVVLWIGCGCPGKKDYKPSGFNEKEKEDFIKEGLSDLKAVKSRNNATILAGYYSSKKITEKALYWANAGAELGDGYCMSLLRLSYAKGSGVLKDHIEATKWMYLAAAKAQVEEEEMLKKVSKLAETNEFAEKTLQEGQEKAKEWIENHREAFFDPN